MSDMNLSNWETLEEILADGDIEAVAKAYLWNQDQIKLMREDLSTLSSRYTQVCNELDAVRGDLMKWQGKASVWELELEAVEMERDSLQDELAAVLGLAKLGAWALDTSREHMSDVDGGDIQDQALGLGILEEVTVEAACSEYCSCAEYYDEFPAQCMRYTKATHDFILSMKPQEHKDSP